MARFGFNSGSYTSQSLSADAQLTQNWYPETDGSAQGKSAIVMYPTPGLSLFATLSDSPIRGVWKVQTPGVAERAFAVAGGTLFEVFSGGTSSVLGVVANDGRPASMCNSNIQLMIASGGQGYCLTLATNVLTGPIANIATVTKVGYSDGFFVALLGLSARIQVSATLDGTSWNPADSAIVSVFPDNVLDMIVDHREVCLLGTKQSVCYYDSGNTFPYDVIPGGFIEQGTAGTFCNVKADNTIFGIWQDERGNAIAFKAQGYTPQRISTHAIEFAWQGYSRIDDCEAYTYQDQGHTFVVFYFPTANKTWVYDIATGLWHQRAFGEADTETAHRARCHMFAFGKHLVGDWASGNIYQMAIPVADGTGGWNFNTDFGNYIRRVRRGPYVGTPEVFNYVNKIEFEIEPGLGIPSGQGSDPLLMLRFSKDGGHTWSNLRQLSVGKIGQYGLRMIMRRFGRFWGTKGIVFELSCTDPIPYRVIDAYLEADPSMSPQERLPHQIRKQA